MPKRRQKADEELDHAEVLTHPDRDVQNLINQYVHILRQQDWGKRDYLRSVRVFWKAHPRDLNVEILIPLWAQKLEAEREKAERKGRKLPEPRYRMQLSQNYKTASIDFLHTNFPFNELIDLLGKFSEGKGFSAQFQHENLKQKLLQNFMAQYPKLVETPAAKDELLAYLKRAYHLTLQEVLKETVKRKHGVEGDKLKQLIIESVDQRCGRLDSLQVLAEQSVNRIGMDILLGAADSMKSFELAESGTIDLGDEHSRLNPIVADEKAGPASKEDEVVNVKAVPPGHVTLDDLTSRSLPVPPIASGQDRPADAAYPEFQRDYLVAAERGGLVAAESQGEALNVTVEEVSPHHVTLDGLGPCSLPSASWLNVGHADAYQEFQQADVQCEHSVAGSQSASCRDDMGEAKTCFVCASIASIPCKGHGNSPCVVEGAFCEAHCLKGVCNLCRPALIKALKTKKAGLKTCASCGSDVIDAPSICTQCNATCCNHCALRWEEATRRKKFICATDATPAVFYKERHDAARAFAKEVEAALETEKTSSPPGKWLLSFCLMMCMLNRHRQFEILKELYHVLKKVLDYQARKGLPPAAILQSERLHFSRGEQASDEFVQGITRMARDAYGRQGHQEQLESYQQRPVKPRKRAHGELPSALPVELAAESRVAVGALISNLGATNDSLNQLVHNALNQVWADSDFELYLLVLDAGNMKQSIKDLVGLFSADRCVCFEPEKTDTEIACCINSLGLRVVLDIVGSRERTMPTLFGLLDRKTNIVHLADGPVPCDGSTWDGCVVDRQTLKALDSRTDAVKGRYVFSSRWPPLDRRVVNGVNRERFRVRDPKSPFNIFVAARMDTLGPDDMRMLLEILRRIQDAILHFLGLPMFCINGILEAGRHIDEIDRVGSQPLRDARQQRGTELESPASSIVSRIKFMGSLPLLEHLQRLRENMDVAVKPRGSDGWDLYTSACVTAGLGVLSVGGRGAGGELELLGLKDLVLGNDDKADPVTERMIRDVVAFRANRALGYDIREHLDFCARHGTSFFDQARFPNEIKALIQKLAGGGAGVLDCATCAPQPPVISRGSNGELRGSSSPDPQFNSLPPDSADLWSEFSCPMAISKGPDSSGKMDNSAPEVMPPKRRASNGCFSLRSHGLARPGPHKLAGCSPRTIDLTDSDLPVARPRPPCQ